jgi:hypothetical protein
MADEKDEGQRDSKQRYLVRELAESVDFCCKLEEGRLAGRCHIADL